jgi:hypothetical protein
VAAAAQQRRREDRPDAAHPPLAAAHGHVVAISLGGGEERAVVGKQGEAVEMLARPRRPQLRAVPARVRCARQPLVPYGEGVVENLFEERAFGEYERHADASNCNAANRLPPRCTTER